MDGVNVARKDVDRVTDNARPILSPKIKCSGGCDHFWPAPKGGLFVGRCKLQHRWLLAEQKCNVWRMHQQEQRQRFRKETRV